MQDDLADRARAVARELRDRGATREQIETAVDRFIREASGNIPPEMRVKPDATSVTPGAGDWAATAPFVRGVLASAPQAIPGVERVQATVRSLARGQPYEEALSDMRGETDPIPLPVKLAAQAPAIMATGKIPLSPLKAGALYGGASQALSADPMSINERATRTATGAVVGGTLGKTLDVGGTFARAHLPGIRPPTPGNLAGSLKENMGATSKVNYDAAYREGAQALNGQASTAIRNVLNHPNIKPFADQVRASQKYVNASDARVLGEAYKLMGKQQKGLQRRMARDGYDAQAALQADDIGIAKDDLLKVADPVMPSFRNAVNAHREMASEIGAVGTGVDAARRVMGAPASGSRLTTQSREAYLKQIKAMSPRNRAAARKGMLGELRERTGLQPNVVSAGGLLTSIHRPAKVANFLREGSDEQQLFIDYLIRSGLAGGAAQAQ